MASHDQVATSTNVQMVACELLWRPPARSCSRWGGLSPSVCDKEASPSFHLLLHLGRDPPLYHPHWKYLKSQETCPWLVIVCQPSGSKVRSILVLIHLYSFYAGLTSSPWNNTTHIVGCVFPPQWTGSSNFFMDIYSEACLFSDLRSCQNDSQY